MKAIAAMSLNRVIGCGNKIPWHLPEDFKWFKRATMSGTVIMGRKTFESLGNRALPGRINFVLSRGPEEFVNRLALTTDILKQLGITRVRTGWEAIKQESIDLSQPVLPGALGMELRVVSGMDVLCKHGLTENAWLCGGASMYDQFLPFCSDLYLTVVQRDASGDAFFPRFEDQFYFNEVVLKYPEFEVHHYRRTGTPLQAGR